MRQNLNQGDDHPGSQRHYRQPSRARIASAFSATRNQEITGHRAWNHRRDSPESRHAHPEIPDHDCDDRSMS